ncbi:HU family DNA-binding protein [Dankookia rubra]|uniref:HU family DNA-binding protein n=1 Tax=Dankookia rubra TaxID=1442381 RepID=A0A4R5QBP0_9PROT|nr:HU family DNA-binding protein [Dankookia rubra]TDH60018.1 HU family DNA-binding protein [Dankookia rubra]
MAKATKTVAAKKPAASAKGDKAPAPSKARVPVKTDGGKAATSGTTAAAISLKQLAAGLAESQDLPKRQVEAMLGEFVQSLAEHLQQGSKIRVPGLGIFQVSARAARMGRNPATGEPIQIKASKKIAFRPAKELKEAI